LKLVAVLAPPNVKAPLESATPPLKLAVPEIVKEPAERANKSLADIERLAMVSVAAVAWVTVAAAVVAIVTASTVPGRLGLVDQLLAVSQSPPPAEFQVTEAIFYPPPNVTSKSSTDGSPQRRRAKTVRVGPALMNG